MSIESMAIVLHHSRARGTAKVVLLGIANHDGDGGAWPSIATLAKYANVIERNVQKALRELEALGEVRIEHRAGGSPRMRPQDRPNLFTLLVTCPEGCDRTSRHRVSEPEVSNSTPPEMSDATPPEVSVATPEPSFEPSSESSLSRSAVDHGAASTSSRRPRPGSQAERTQSKKAERAEALMADLAAQFGGRQRVITCLRRCHGSENPVMWALNLNDFGQLDGLIGNRGLGESCWNCGGEEIAS